MHSRWVVHFRMVKRSYGTCDDNTRYRSHRKVPTVLSEQANDRFDRAARGVYADDVVRNPFREMSEQPAIL